MINRQKLQIFIDEYKQKFINDLDETCKDLLDINDNNLIDLDEEYNIPPSEYIKTDPMIHLDVDKIVSDNDEFKGLIIETNRIDTNNPNFDANSIKKLSSSDSSIIQKQNNTIKNNFPINTKLTHNEYIIKFYMITLDNYKNSKQSTYYNFDARVIKDHNKDCTDKYIKFPGCKCKVVNSRIDDKYTIIYITNYGRIIQAENINNYIFQNIHTENGGYTHFSYYKTTDKFKIIENNKLYFCSIVSDILTKIQNPDSIKLVDVPIFNYKIPKIFIDVIDAFHKQDNDLMQTSCKKYLETLNKTKGCDKIIEKDRIIEEQKNIISSKDKEIERLKLELEELRKFYINS